MKLLLAFGLLAGFQTFAAVKNKGQFRINTEITYDGKPISSPAFVVVAGGEAALETKPKDTSQFETHMKVKARDTKPASRNILLSYSLELRNQTKEIKNSGEFILTPGQTETVKLSTDAKEPIIMKVTGERE